jgi:3-oxoacyl-[acyl-carrier protein] reductase
VVGGDVRVKADVDRIVAAAAEHGPVEVAVNAAGVLRTGLLARQRVEDWTLVIETNLIGPYLVSRAVVGPMLRRRYGRIINLVSPAAMVASPGQTAYAASKAALVSLTRSLAAECGPRNVTVNAISPGFVESKMTASVSDVVRSAILDRVALRRAASAEDVAKGVDFILDCDYVTGQVIAIDGGISFS